MTLLYSAADPRKKPYILSQDELHHILSELVNSSPLGTRKLNQLKQLERERRELVAAVENSQRQYLAFENSKQILSQLLNEHDFDAEMQKMGYPAKVLNGKIKLDSDRQKVALDELQVTLSVKSDLPEALHKIIAALKLYYKKYFTHGQPCQKEDQKLKSELEAFDLDVQRGSNPDFIAYNEYQKVLSAVELGKVSLTKVNDLVKCDFSLALFSEWLQGSKNISFQNHLLNFGQWDISHVSMLEYCFENTVDDHFAKACLDKIIQLSQAPSSSFLNRQLENDVHPDLVRTYLQTLDDEQLHQRQEESLAQNLQHLLGALINLRGLDQKYFYRMLSNSGLRHGVFRHLVESLFNQNQPQGVYGMDHGYAKQVLNEHSASPSNVIATLQKALPRGFEGTQIESFFQFMQTINEQLKDGLNKKEQLDRLKQHDKTYSQQLLHISNLQTIRFLLFSYIYDRINSSNTNYKALGLSGESLKNHIEIQYQFEVLWGKNKNILNYIQSLYKKSPELKAHSAAEVES